MNHELYLLCIVYYYMKINILKVYKLIYLLNINDTYQNTILNTTILNFL